MLYNLIHKILELNRQRETNKGKGKTPSLCISKDQQLRNMEK